MSRFILSADWHIRSSRPQYRVDDYAETILRKAEFIVDTANKYKANLIIAGDIFHNIRVGIRTVNRVLRILKKMERDVYCVPGQHDMENHGADLTPTPYQTLIEAGVIINLGVDPVDNIYGAGWEQELGDFVETDKETILVIHHSITPEEPPFFLENSAMSAKDIMEKCPEFKFIVSGDYHVPHITKGKNQIVFNCGCIGRSDKNQIDFEPVIYVLDTADGKHKKIKIPIESGETVFHIPKDTSSMDMKFSENITGIMNLINSEQKPDFITTVHFIMNDDQFTDKQRLIADKFYNEWREV